MQRLVIYGTGGFAREVIDLVDDINAVRKQFTVLGLLEDQDATKHGTTIDGYAVLGGMEWAAAHPEVLYVVAIGNPAGKRRVVTELFSNGCSRFATLVHPTAIMGRKVLLGQGSIICANVVITTNVQIGDHVSVNWITTIGHDATVEEYCTLYPGVRISGNVKVSAGCEFGANSIIIQGKKCGHWSVIGAGAVIVKDLPANTTAVGVPAQVIKVREEGWQNS